MQIINAATIAAVVTLVHIGNAVAAPAFQISCQTLNTQGTPTSTFNPGDRGVLKVTITLPQSVPKTTAVRVSIQATAAVAGITLPYKIIGLGTLSNSNPGTKIGFPTETLIQNGVGNIRFEVPKHFQHFPSYSIQLTVTASIPGVGTSNSCVVSIND